MQRKSTYVLWTCIYIHVYVHFLNLDVEMCAHVERDMWGFLSLNQTCHSVMADIAFHLQFLIHALCNCFSH